MKNSMHGRHNQHNILQQSARADQNSQADEGISVGFAAVETSRLISTDAIRHHAYGKWATAGKPPGDGIAFWLEAERELAAADGDNLGHGNSQDADRHAQIRHPHSVKL